MCTLIVQTGVLLYDMLKWRKKWRIQPYNAGASCMYTATSIYGLVGDVTFHVSEPRGEGTGRHWLPAAGIRVPIHSQCMPPSHPGIDLNVRCNCRERTIQYMSLYYPDSIQGCNPSFQTKYLVNIEKELLSKACDNSDCQALALLSPFL